MSSRSPSDPRKPRKYPTSGSLVPNLLKSPVCVLFLHLGRCKVTTKEYYLAWKVGKTVRTESTVLSLCDSLLLTYMVNWESCPWPLAPGLERMLMEKQAPLVPGSIRAESSFNSLLFISPPSLLQNACLAPRDTFMTVPYMSYLVFIPNYHAIHTIHCQINLAVNGIWLLR